MGLLNNINLYRDNECPLCEQTMTPTDKNPTYDSYQYICKTCKPDGNVI